MSMICTSNFLRFDGISLNLVFSQDLQDDKVSRTLIETFPSGLQSGGIDKPACRLSRDSF